MRNFQPLYLVVNLGFRFAQAGISLGAASTYGALSCVSMTNSGSTTIYGDIGSTGSSITGFPPGNYTGSEHTSDDASSGLNAAQSAYDAIAALTGAVTLSGDLGGQVLPPGVYTYPAAAQLTEVLTLAGTGDCNDAWYFQIGSTLTTAVAASVIMTGGSFGTVFWNVGSSATIGIGTGFVGNILASVSVTMNDYATIRGGVFALGASVVLNSNTVQLAEVCTASPSSASSATPSIINICSCYT